jgi:hypothetical protein
MEKTVDLFMLNENESCLKDIPAESDFLSIIFTARSQSVTSMSYCTVAVTHV